MSVALISSAAISAASSDTAESFERFSETGIRHAPVISRSSSFPPFPIASILAYGGTAGALPKIPHTAQAAALLILLRVKLLVLTDEQNSPSDDASLAAL